MVKTERVILNSLKDVIELIETERKIKSKTVRDMSEILFGDKEANIFASYRAKKRINFNIVKKGLLFSGYNTLSLYGRTNYQPPLVEIRLNNIDEEGLKKPISSVLDLEIQKKHDKIKELLKDKSNAYIINKLRGREEITLTSLFKASELLGIKWEVSCNG